MEESQEKLAGRSVIAPLGAFAKWVRLVARASALLAAALGAIHLSTIVRATQDRASFDSLLGWAAQPWSSAWLPAAFVALSLLHAVLSLPLAFGRSPQALALYSDKNTSRAALRIGLGAVASLGGAILVVCWQQGGLRDYDRLCAVMAATWFGVPLPATLVLLVSAACFAHVGLGLDAWLRGRPGHAMAPWIGWCAAASALVGFVFALVSVLQLATGSGSPW